MFVYWLMLVLQKGNRCSLFFLKRHLPSSSFYESRRRQPSIPTAQARLQGLQADPRRLANAHAAHKTPGKTSASTAVRRLALWGRAVSEDCQAASAALLHPVNPLPSITRSARLNKQRSGDLSLHSPENFGDSAIFPTDKISASLIEILSSRSHKTPAGLCPSPHRGSYRLRYHSAEWTVGTPWPARFQLRWHLRLRLGNVSTLPFLSACT